MSHISGKRRRSYKRDRSHKKQKLSLLSASKKAESSNHDKGKHHYLNDELAETLHKYIPEKGILNMISDYIDPCKHRVASNPQQCGTTTKYKLSSAPDAESVFCNKTCFESSQYWLADCLIKLLHSKIEVSLPEMAYKNKYFQAKTIRIDQYVYQHKFSCKSESECAELQLTRGVFGINNYNLSIFPATHSTPPTQPMEIRGHIQNEQIDEEFRNAIDKFAKVAKNSNYVYMSIEDWALRQYQNVDQNQIDDLTHLFLYVYGLPDVVHSKIRRSNGYHTVTHTAQVLLQFSKTNPFFHKNSQLQLVFEHEINPSIAEDYTTRVLSTGLFIRSKFKMEDMSKSEFDKWNSDVFSALIDEDTHCAR